MNVAWFSCGVSSAIACWLCRNEIDEIHYQHVEDQHPDSLRFLHDVEKLVGKQIVVHRSPYKTVECVCRSFRFLKGFNGGAKCTDVLKRRERKVWEKEHPGQHTYYWGLDVTETKRADRIVAAMPNQKHIFPLITRGMTKQNCHELAFKLGLKRPEMYDLGYENNNCIGCIRGGIGYWNKIRKDFPDVFAARAKLERELGRFILKDGDGNPLWLDELSEFKGRKPKEIPNMECGIMCEINFNEGYGNEQR